MSYKLLSKVSLAALIATCTTAAFAADHTFRLQILYGPESPSGKLATQFVEDVETMSGGRIDIEIFYSASVVKSTETFDAAASGILDADMTSGAYQVGKDPAFQFVGDLFGFYDNPWQMYAWLYSGDNMQKVQELYGKYNMHFVGWWLLGAESMSSSRPLEGVESLKGYKFRSPAGPMAEIFAEFGASPVVMDFSEVFTGLETGVIEGADASSLANNVGSGLLDIVKNATYPGFHSLPADHLAIRKDAWDALPDDLKRIMEVAMQKLSLQTTITHFNRDIDASVELKAKGVNLTDWSKEDRATFRQVAQEKMRKFAEKSPESGDLLQRHLDYLQKLGLAE